MLTGPLATNVREIWIKHLVDNLAQVSMELKNMGNMFNSLAPGDNNYHFENIIFKNILQRTVQAWTMRMHHIISLGI